ncbi:hypothetical protein AGR4B_pAt20339 [Agrobacterium tumefaciens str. CFBP 5621]|nr:hypothetical protein AGR4B_pAt20339 [Agrobacterium tumefaciens str. CFBP 5621]
MPRSKQTLARLFAGALPKRDFSKSKPLQFIPSRAAIRLTVTTEGLRFSIRPMPVIQEARAVMATRSKGWIFRPRRFSGTGLRGEYSRPVKFTAQVGAGTLPLFGPVEILSRAISKA